MTHNLIENIYSQSPPQQAMFLETLRSPGSGVNVIQLVWTLSGPMNVVAFEQAWKQIIARHSIMRTSFILTRQNKALQVVRSNGEPDLSYGDWRGLSESNRRDRLNALLKADARRGFEFSKSAPLRFYLLRLSVEEPWFVWSVHHLLLDRWSLSNVVQELFASYDGFRIGRPVRLERSRPYGEYIAWLQKQDPSKSEIFWSEQLKGFKAPTSLDWALKPKHLRTGNGTSSGSVGVEHVTVPADISERIKAVARAHRLTLSTLIQAAWAMTLSHYSGSSDVVFGTVLSGRSMPVVGIATMVGPFLNVLPMRVRIATQEILLSFLQRVQETQISISQYEYCHSARVQSWSEIPHDIQMFWTMIDFVNYTFRTPPTDLGGGLRNTAHRSVENVGIPISVLAYPEPQLKLEVSYNSKLLNGQSVAGALRSLASLLAAIPDNVHLPVAIAQAGAWTKELEVMAAQMT